LVVSWGRMWRAAASIYGRNSLQKIEEALHDCRDSISRTNNIKDAWESLRNGLNWTDVMISKTLHFLTRSMGYVRNPPVAIDHKVIIDNVWSSFKNGLPSGSQVSPWSAGTRSPFEYYNRYMTAVQVWAEARGWTTTEVEATIFAENPG